MRWPWQPKTAPVERKPPPWAGLSHDDQLAWFDAQPWAEDARRAWNEYWAGKSAHSPISDGLARIRFMAAWWRAREEDDGSELVTISLPFIGLERMEWLHFEEVYSRARFKDSP